MNDKLIIKIKRNNILFLILIIINVIGFFSFLIEDPSLKVEAATKIIGGMSCQQNLPDCPAGTTRFIDAITSRSIKATGGISQKDLQEAIQETYKVGQDDNFLYNFVCIDDSYLGTEIIAVDVGLTPNYSTDEDLINQDNLIFKTLVPRMCPKGTSSAKYELLGDTEWWCCNSANSVVALGNNLNASGIIERLCCPSGSHNSIGTNNACVTTSGDVLGTAQPTVDAIQLGAKQLNTGMLSIGIDQPGANLVCAAEHSCALVEQAGGGEALTIKVNGVDKQYSLIQKSILETDDSYGDSCSKCFTNEEAIGLDGDTDELLICTNGAVTRQPLINGNVNDTLAYIAAQKASGSENAEQLKTCRERGGIYIAIGCVDPTPLGILTGLIRIAFGIMGGVALAQLIYAGLMYQSGDEEKIAAARSKVLSTIAGIAVLVFSVLILRIIGVNVLDILPEGAI